MDRLEEYKLDVMVRAMGEFEPDDNMTYEDILVCNVYILYIYNRLVRILSVNDLHLFQSKIPFHVRKITYIYRVI